MATARPGPARYDECAVPLPLLGQVAGPQRCRRARPVLAATLAPRPTDDPAGDTTAEQAYAGR